jgi:hypothetical protein
VNSETDARERFFRAGVEGWRRVTGADRETYVCPLCEGSFGREALDSRELTLEHVPPESVGGRLLTLTCRPCNSVAGHTIDSEVHRRDQLLDMNRAIFSKVGVFSTKARLEIDGIPLNVHLDVRDGSLTVEVHEVINDPAQFQAQMEHLRTMKESGKVQEVLLQLTPRLRFHIWRSQISDLRSAFLACFAGFGYSWAMLPSLDPIREQIRTPNTKLVQNAWLIRPAGFPQENVILGLRHPAPALAVFVGMTMVLLPWFTSPPDLYEIIGRSFDPQRTLTVEGEVLGWPTTMEMRVDLSP